MKSDSKMLEALRQFQAGETLHHSALAALLKREWLLPDGKNGYAVSPTGENQLNPPKRYRVERHQKEKAWLAVTDWFSQQADAEDAARLLSISNHGLYRVVTHAADDGFPVYEFGKRYIQHDDVRVSQPNFSLDEAEGDGLFWTIQRRLSHRYNMGRFSPWAVHGERHYAALEDADYAAHEFAHADTDAYEYRVLPDGMPTLDVMVYVKDDLQPDLGLLDLMVARTTPATGGTVAQRRAMAAATLIADWATTPDMLQMVVKNLQERLNAQN